MMVTINGKTQERAAYYNERRSRNKRFAVWDEEKQRYVQEKQDGLEPSVVIKAQ